MSQCVDSSQGSTIYFYCADFRNAQVINRSLDEASGLTDNFDDAEGYYKLILGETLDNGRYHVHANLGKGMFSGVVRAKDLTSLSGAEVAIKVIRSQESMYVQPCRIASSFQRILLNLWGLAGIRLG